MRLGLILLVILSGLSTIFISLVTMVEAWQEHTQAQWPEVSARVERCRLDQTSSGRRDRYYIHCQLTYAVGAERNVANVYSSNVPSPDVWQYPRNQIQPYEDWVDRHPPGTPLVVRYDPAHRTKVALVATDMPRGGPRTASNLKQLAVWAGSFLVLSTIARAFRKADGRLGFESGGD